MKERLPLVLAATALVVAVFGSTPLGNAARNVVHGVPPFAKKAGFATNAGAVGGIKASRNARPNYIVALGKNGKFPPAVGQVGPPGPPGPHGDQGVKGDTGAIGPPGLSELQVVTAQTGSDSSGTKTVGVDCPSGKKAIGGGAVENGPNEVALTNTNPKPDATGWIAQAREVNGTGASWSATVYAICAKVS